MFLHLSVILFTGEGRCTAPSADTPWQTHTLADTPPPPTRRPLQRTVRILLECILVVYKYSLLLSMKEPLSWAFIKQNPICTNWRIFFDCCTRLYHTAMWNIVHWNIYKTLKILTGGVFLNINSWWKFSWRPKSESENRWVQFGSSWLFCYVASWNTFLLHLLNT